MKSVSLGTVRVRVWDIRRETKVQVVFPRYLTIRRILRRNIPREVEGREWPAWKKKAAMSFQRSQVLNFIGNLQLFFFPSSFKHSSRCFFTPHLDWIFIGEVIPSRYYRMTKDRSRKFKPCLRWLADGAWIACFFLAAGRGSRWGLLLFLNHRNQ